MGPIALAASAVVATLALVSSIARPAWERRVLGTALALATTALVNLAVLLVREDTSYVLVVDHTRPGLDVFRRVMGLWGGSEGSLLVFVTIVGWTVVAAPLREPFRVARTLTVAVLLASSALVASPFEQLDTPAIAGSGLSPILEHWAMLIHPPLLYLGLALALVPAGIDPPLRRRWTISAIAVLTTALALGGGWAYVELGWGGWWAWDPVENAALIPWLALVATVHLPSNHHITRWSTLLIWPLVFAGTAMTRTSLRTSVHAFANSEALGWALWPLAAALTAIVILHGVGNRGLRAAPIPRHMLLPVIIILSAAVVVALGTFRPFVPGDATEGTFYTRFLYPSSIIGLLGLGIAPRLRSASAMRLAVESAIGGVLGIGLAAAAGWTTWWQLVLAGALGSACVTTLGAGNSSSARTMAHLGMVFVLAGALGGTASTTQTFSIAVDGIEEINGIVIINRGVDLESSAQPVLTATVEVDGSVVQPSLTVYPERRLRLPEVATVRSVHRDVQVILRSADDDGTATITVNVEPLTQFVWIGSLLIVLSMFTLAPSAMARRARDAREGNVSRSVSPDASEAAR